MNAPETMTTITATYSPDDNKLRLYSLHKLPRELYDRVRAAGFAWAPKQELFVAPAWTPERADLCLELAGDIEDEDKSLGERADERADRFEEYSDRREADAERQRSAVAAIADGIPLGQPILVGHHSEARARRDAERIQSGIRRAVKLWDTAQYWTRRAAAAKHAAAYKERPDVRARRIKTIEADKRKQERNRADSVKYLEAWRVVEKQPDDKRHAAGMYVANFDRACFGTYSDLRDHKITVDTAAAKLIRVHERCIERCDRWIAHFDNRLAYERAMLEEAGGTAADRVGPEVGGACKCWASPRGGWSYIRKVNRISVTVLDNWGNGGKNFTRTIPFDKLTEVMTRAQVDEARAAGLVVDTTDGTGFGLLTERPKASEPAQPAPNASDFEDLRVLAKDGVKVIAAPQLFPTPPELAARMAEIAGIEVGHDVLEPSAGTGAIWRELSGKRVAVEINRELAARLRDLTTIHDWVICADFLTLQPGDYAGNVPETTPIGMFDRIVMNPPFADGADVRHISHAITFLKPGGRLVAICANGPRQHALRTWIENNGGTWEELPEGTFRDAGTMVRTALVVYDAP